jgi:hypothetical protein
VCSNIAKNVARTALGSARAKAPVKPLVFNARVKVKSRISPRYIDSKEEARCLNEKRMRKKKTRKTGDLLVEPVKGKECPECGKLTIVRTTPNAGWIRFQCLSCGWRKDIYIGF